MDQESKMIGSWEVEGLTRPELFYVLAEANFDAAVVLSAALKANIYRQTYSHVKVICALVHHGTELFLKYAIARAGENPPTHHQIAMLWGDYRKYYPDPVFSFEPPYVKVFMGYTEDQVRELIEEEFSPNHRNESDQQTRYHTDRSGKTWPLAEGCIPESYHEKNRELLETIHRLHRMIEDKP